MKLTLDVLNKVINLAEERRLVDESLSKNNFFNGLSLDEVDKYINSKEYRPYKQAEEMLLKYLNQLDFDTIKELQVLMYLGRDKDFRDVDDGLKRFDLLKKEFDDRGWRSCNIEINQMFEKIPLGEYLQEGKNIIGW